MWCDFCRVPVAGEKATHRLRGAVVASTLIGTAGLSGLAARSDAYHCPRCGQPVRHARPEDFAWLAAAQQDALRQADTQQPEPNVDWREVPTEEVPPWRKNDRERLDWNTRRETPDAPVTPNPDLADRLAGLARLHDQGALTDEEFAAAKARLISEA